MGTLGENNHVLLEFLISRETQTECNYTHMLDFLKANFNKLRTRISKVPWQEILTRKGVQEGWELLIKEIIKAQLQTIPTRKKVGGGKKGCVASQKAQGGPKNQKRHVQEVERKLGHQGLVQTSSKEMQRWH